MYFPTWLIRQKSGKDALVQKLGSVKQISSMPPTLVFPVTRTARSVRRNKLRSHRATSIDPEMHEL